MQDPLPLLEGIRSGPRLNPESARFLALPCRVLNRKAREELGFAPRPLEQSLRDGPA